MLSQINIYLQGYFIAIEVRLNSYQFSYLRQLPIQGSIQYVFQFPLGRKNPKVGKTPCGAVAILGPACSRPAVQLYRYMALWHQPYAQEDYSWLICVRIQGAQLALSGGPKGRGRRWPRGGLSLVRSQRSGQAQRGAYQWIGGLPPHKRQAIPILFTLS